MAHKNALCGFVCVLAVDQASTLAQDYRAHIQIAYSDYLVIRPDCIHTLLYQMRMQKKIRRPSFGRACI